MLRRKQFDLVSVAFNDIAYIIGKDKYSQLSKQQINTIISYDAQNKIYGAGLFVRTSG